jgi:uncharacterized DUF497 family protein
MENATLPVALCIGLSLPDARASSKREGSTVLTKLLLSPSITNLDFEWDDIKAAENVRNHGVSFAQAASTFLDPFAVEWIDLREAYGEERIILLGMTSNQVLTVVYTERAERIRIISARRATKNEQDHYYRQNAP